jgi:phage recombination protein Bet
MTTVSQALAERRQQQPAPAAGGSLALRADQEMFDGRQQAALRALGVEGASVADLAVYLHYCQKTGLDPFSKQIYYIRRKDRWTIQVGIDGFRVIARRAVTNGAETLAYLDTQWCGPEGQWMDVWLGGAPPFAARVTVLRNGCPFPGVVRYDSYVQKARGEVTEMWQRMPAEQLEKCAEAKALRRAFPNDLGGMYIDEEMPPPEPRPARPGRRAAEPARPAAEAAAEPSPPPGEEDDTLRVSGRVLGALRREFTRLGLGDDEAHREQRLRVTETVIGRTLGKRGARDLTAAEADQVLERLNGCETGEELHEALFGGPGSGSPQ